MKIKTFFKNLLESPVEKAAEELLTSKLVKKILKGNPLMKDHQIILKEKDYNSLYKALVKLKKEMNR